MADPAELVVGRNKTISELSGRLELIQDRIKDILDIGDDIFRIAAPDAPHPSLRTDTPTCKVDVYDATVRSVVINELMVTIDATRSVRIDRYTPGYRPGQSDYLRRQWFYRPHESGHTLQTVATEAIRAKLPFNIESALYDNSHTHRGFIDLLFEDPDQILVETRQAYVDALELVS